MADSLTQENLAKMKVCDLTKSYIKNSVADLKKELKERGLSTSGAKSELLERLKTFLAADDSSVLLAADDSIDLNNSSILTEEVKEVKEKIVAQQETELPKTETDDKKEEFHPVKVTIAHSTDTDMLKKRAERFGVINEDIKKQQRAERFGTQSSEAGQLSTAGSGTNVGVLKKRAERFGQVLSSSLAKQDEEERIRKRKERFGNVISPTNTTNTTNPPTSPPSKFAKITFDSKDDEKKKKRAERFGIV